MTIYDADHLAELEMQEDVLKQYNQAVQDSVAEGQESKPEEVVEESQEQVQEEIQEPVQKESDSDRNWRAMREKEREMQAELARLREEHAYLKGQFESRREQHEENPLDDEDLLSVGQGKRMLDEVRQQYEQQIAEMKLEQEENRMRSQYSDYDEVMEKYSIPLLQNNPDFAQGFRNAQNKAFYAYQIGRGLALENKMKELERAKSQPQRNQAERIVENARRPGTLSNVGGGQQQISKADYWATLSDEDFMKEASRNLDGI